MRFLERPLDRSALAGLVACGLLVACNGSPDEEGGLAPPVEDAEGIDTSAAVEPEPSESEPDDATEESDGTEPIGDDEPLYAPLPELTPDPDNDIPDDFEQEVLEAYQFAYHTEFEMYATGSLDEERLLETHALEAFAAVANSVMALAEAGIIERSPDTTIDDVSIVEADAHSALVRECVTIGPRTGDYDQTTSEPVALLEPGPQAREVRIRYVGLEGEEEPRLRVTDVSFTDGEGCS